jgi:hypothetical protein
MSARVRNEVGDSGPCGRTMDLAGDDVIVFIDSWPLISLKILLATNQISRMVTHGNPVDFTKGSPNVRK